MKSARPSATWRPVTGIACTANTATEARLSISRRWRRTLSAPSSGTTTSGAARFCNSNYKGNGFPLDDKGLPLLINPTRDEPREHIEFSPRSGKLSGRTPKGDTTIDVLGFDRRGNLDKTRLFAWRSVQCCLVSYYEACTEGNSGTEHWRSSATCASTRTRKPPVLCSSRFWKNQQAPSSSPSGAAARSSPPTPKLETGFEQGSAAPMALRAFADGTPLPLRIRYPRRR